MSKHITTNEATVPAEGYIEIVEVRRRSVGGLLAAAVAGLICFGVVGASAATLGDLKVGSLGASAEEVVSCDTDGLSIRWNQHLNGSEGYATDTVIVEDISERCNGLTISVGVLTAEGDVLAEAQAKVDGTGVKVEIGKDVPTNKIHQVAISIAE